MTIFEPFVSRELRALDLWSIGAWRLKPTLILRPGAQRVEATIEAVREQIDLFLGEREVAPPFHGVGFVGIHCGRGATFAFLDRWARENELHHQVWVSQGEDSSDFRPAGPDDAPVCVWDLELQGLERDLWIRCCLGGETPDLAAYLKRGPARGTGTLVREAPPLRETRQRLAERLAELGPRLRRLPSGWPGTRLREGGWTRLEILGHLLDSALVNEMRFRRGRFDPLFRVEPYDPDALVASAGYAGAEPSAIESALLAVNQRILAQLGHLDAAGQEGTRRLDVAAGRLVTLGELAADYLAHLEHHLDQILAPEPMAVG